MIKVRNPKRKVNPFKIRNQRLATPQASSGFLAAIKKGKNRVNTEK